MSENTIGNIGNYYGCLTVRADEDGTCCWSIEDWNGHNWEEIPRSLYVELMKYEADRIIKGAKT